MKKLMTAVAVLLAGFGSLAADYAFYTYGDAAWIQTGDVWLSGDLRGLATEERAYVESVLELTVTAPCAVEFDAGIYPYFAKGSYYGAWDMSVDGEYWSLDAGYQSGRKNVVFVGGSGFKTIRILTYAYEEWPEYEQAQLRISNVKVTSAPASVTVSFDASGGSVGISEKTFATSVPYDELPEPVRGGCTFLGWFTAKIGGDRIIAGADVRFDVTTLYAHWSIPLATACGNSVSLRTEDYSWIEPYRNWYGTPDESHDGSSAAMIDSNGSWRPLYMEVTGPGTLSFWWKSKEGAYGYFYDANGRRLADIYPNEKWDSASQTWKYGVSDWQQVTIPVYGTETTEFYIEGSVDGDGSCLLVDEIRWAPVPTSVMVKFDPAGGTVSPVLRNYSVSDGYDVLPVPKREGWDFDGWFTDPVVGRKAEEGGTFYFDASVLHAHWSIPLDEALGLAGSKDLTDIHAEIIDGSDAEAWFGTPDYAHDGSGAACSRGDGLGSASLTAAYHGNGTLSFWWKTIGNAGAYLWVGTERKARVSLEAVPVMDFESNTLGCPEGEWQKVEVDLNAEDEIAFEDEWEDDEAALRNHVQWMFRARAADAKVLVADVSWKPAPDEITVRFMKDKHVVWSEVTYAPGDVFYGAGVLCAFDPPVADPVREGYVFAGWYRDTELLEPLDWNSRVPYSGAVVYAKWTKPLAAAPMDGLTFENVDPMTTDPILALLYTPTVWEAVEDTYDDGSTTLRTGLEPDVGEMYGTEAVAAMETTVGSGFLDLLWSIYPYSSDSYGFASLAFFVDGEEIENSTRFEQSDGEAKIALGSGSHKVRVEATGVNATAVLTGVRFEEMKTAETLGGWLRRFLDYGFWTKNNLSAIKSATAAAKSVGTAEGRYRAAIEHALTTVLMLAEDKLVSDTLKQFGFTFGLERIEAPGSFKYANTPTFNTLVNNAFAKVQPAIETALADLDLIPADWNGTVPVSAKAYPVDEDFVIDRGDVLYLKSLLKAALGAAHWLKAYNTEFDWAKLDSDIRGVKIPTISVAPKLESDANWSSPVEFSKGALELEESDMWSFGRNVETLSESGIGTSGKFRVAWYRNCLCLKLDKGEFTVGDLSSIDIVLESGSLAGHVEKYFGIRRVNYDPLTGLACPEKHWMCWDLEVMPVIAAEENESAVMIEIDLTGTEVAKNTALRYLRSLHVNSSETLEESEERSQVLWRVAGFHAVDSKVVQAALDQKTMFNKVRDAASLVKSKTCVSEALRLAQAADDFILNGRTCAGTCLVNYDEADADSQQAAREQIETALASLSAPQATDWSKGLPGELVSELYYLENPIDVYLGALFGGKVVRGLVPDSLRTDAYAPKIDEMSDATLGGLLPGMTKDKWASYAEAGNLEHRNDPFGVVEPEEAYELYPGESVRIPVEIVTGGAKVTVTADKSTLPTGLTFDAAKYVLSGTPTKPGDYSVAITVKSSKVTSVGRIRVHVAELPALAVRVESNVANCKASGAGKYLVGKSVTLQVTVPKGAVFLGWFTEEGVEWPNADTCKKTKMTYKMGRDSVNLVARFKGEEMSISCDGLSATSFTVGVNSAAEGIPVMTEVESKVKEVKVTGLPSGMSYNSKTGKIVGVPTKSGEFTAVVKLTSMSGSVKTESFTFSVAAIPDAATDVFNGFVADENGMRQGTFSLTASDIGKLTAKIVLKSGSYSFSASCWTSLSDEGVYSATLKTKKGEVLSVAVDASKDWNGEQLTGEVVMKDGMCYDVTAQRNAFRKGWPFKAVEVSDGMWSLELVESSKQANVTVSVKADGSTQISGKLGSLKVSASGSVNVAGIREGVLRADFAPVVTIQKKKRILNIVTDLRFDLDYQDEPAGSARLDD